MTKKDYEVLARVLKLARTKDYDLFTIEFILGALTAELQRDNQRFNASRFISAAREN